MTIIQLIIIKLYLLSNSVQLDANYLKKKLPKNIKNKNYSSKTIDLKNNKSIFSWFNLVQNKRKYSISLNINLY